VDPERNACDHAKQAKRLESIGPLVRRYGLAHELEDPFIAPEQRCDLKKICSDCWCSPCATRLSTTDQTNAARQGVNLLNDDSMTVNNR
jgi:hypothetical protein